MVHAWYGLVSYFLLLKYMYVEYDYMDELYGWQMEHTDGNLIRSCLLSNDFLCVVLLIIKEMSWRGLNCKLMS